MQTLLRLKSIGRSYSFFHLHTFNIHSSNISGVGLLQHYIRGGKTTKDIEQIVYKFCVSLQIQTPRVCEGFTELFGVSIFKQL